MCFGEMLHHRQADTAQALALRREKWLEGAAHGLLRHSDTSISDTELKKCSIALNVNRNLPAIWHCVTRVEHEVQDCILQANLIAFRGRQAWFDADLKPDMRLACASNECLDLSQATADVGGDSFVTEFLGSADRLPHKSAGPLQGSLGADDHGLEFVSQLDVRVAGDAIQGRGRDLNEVTQVVDRPNGRLPRAAVIPISFGMGATDVVAQCVGFLSCA
jgi:hypothetical protein